VITHAGWHESPTCKKDRMERAEAAEIFAWEKARKEMWVSRRRRQSPIPPGHVLPRNGSFRRCDAASSVAVVSALWRKPRASL